MLLLLACARPPVDTDDTGLDRVVEGPLTLPEAQQCPSPAPTTTYTESGEAWGLLSPENTSLAHEEGPTIASGDIDNDGLDDLVIVNVEGVSYAYRNTGTSFTATDLSSLLVPSLTLLLHDLDGDGDLDLMRGGSAPSSLTNEGGVFARETPLPNTATAGMLIHDFAPGDLDSDGVIELYMPLTYNFFDPTHPANDLVMVGSSGAYAYDADAVPTEVGYRHSIDAVWFDADGDLDQDVYVVNDFGMLYGASTLLRNDGGTLSNAEDDCYCSVLKNAKGVDIDDYDADGRADIFVSGNPSDTLLSQLEDGTFVDVTTLANAAAIDPDATGWGGIFLDYDNDGQRDLLPSQGDRWNDGNDHLRFDAPLKLLRQQDGVYADVSLEMGITAVGSFRAVSALDFNRDGVEDLLVTSMDGRPLLYLSDGCTEAGWLEVEAPVGSVVQVETGGRTQTNWVKTDSGYQSHRPPRVHFGLGSAQTVDKLTVTLVDGTTFSATEFAARRRIVIEG
ncbi:MAG: CRTAC1 family protein [Pseudomonadota bacterium]|nr:CRTAC1 family protein [Pseudomonadota bacterium]